MATVALFFVASVLRLRLSDASLVASFVRIFIHNQQGLLHLCSSAASFNIIVISVGFVFVCRRQWWWWPHSLTTVMSLVLLDVGSGFVCLFVCLFVIIVGIIIIGFFFVRGQQWMRWLCSSLTVLESISCIVSVWRLWLSLLSLVVLVLVLVLVLVVFVHCL